MPKVIDGDVPVGEVRSFSYSSTLPDGWKLLDGTTIGSAASGAASASAYNYFLFIHLWNNYSNAQLVIQTSGGSPTTRGANADADWTANKRMPLPDMGSGKAAVGKGSSFAFGNSGGVSSVQLTSAQSGVGVHLHGMGVGANDATTVQIGVQRFANFYNDAFAFAPSKTVSNNTAANAVSAHENMPPYHVVSWAIKY